MKKIIATSKVDENYETIIPKEIIEKFNVDLNTIIDWSINDDGNLKLNFIKKEILKS